MLTFKLSSTEQSSITFDRNVTDVLKFIACLMVALGHYCGYCSVSNVHNVFVDAIRVVSPQFGYLGVALFFLLSGYGLMMSDKKKHLEFGAFIRRRLSKTYLPAVLVSVIWLGINIVINEMGGVNLLCNQKYLLGVIWWFNDEVMWFVRTIIVLYLFFYLFRWLDVIICKVKDFSYVSLINLLVIGTIATYLVRWAGIGDPMSVPLFFIGTAIARWPEKAKRIFRSIPILLMVLISIVAIAYLWRSDNRVLHCLINYFVMTAFVSLLAFVDICIDRMPKWVGSCSYDLYLVHYKAHLLLVFFCGVDLLWMFVLGTGLATIGFYHLRKMCKL